MESRLIQKKPLNYFKEKEEKIQYINKYIEELKKTYFKTKNKEVIEALIKDWYLYLENVRGNRKEE